MARGKKKTTPCPWCRETGYVIDIGGDKAACDAANYCSCDAGEAAQHRDEDLMNDDTEREFN